MNEEELKNLWQADDAAPTIDFNAFQKSLTAWQNKLRRKVRIDIWAQSIAAGLTLIPLFFYPKMIFASLMVIILGVWYVRELRGLYKLETNEFDDITVKNSLNAKILTMKIYFRHTRIAMYVFTPLIIPALFYGLNILNNPSITAYELIRSLSVFFIIYELLTFTATEIYFKVLYTPALNELKNLLRQLDLEIN